MEKKKRTILLLLMLGMLIMAALTGCGPGGDEYISMVKDGTSYAYPGKTFGEAFDDFFASPKWSYFVGTQDGSDEEFKVVEFTGRCTYLDQEVKARIQFTIDEDAGEFEATYLSLNDVPQNMLMMAALMEKVFTDE